MVHPEINFSIEATVKNFSDDLVFLETTGCEKSISWPRTALPQNISIGEKFILEVKNDPMTSIEKIVQTAKNENDEKTAVMRKLLEELIN